MLAGSLPGTWIWAECSQPQPHNVFLSDMNSQEAGKLLMIQMKLHPPFSFNPFRLEFCKKWNFPFIQMRSLGLNVRNLSKLYGVRISWGFHQFQALGLKFGYRVLETGFFKRLLGTAVFDQYGNGRCLKSSLHTLVNFIKSQWWGMFGVAEV